MVWCASSDVGIVGPVLLQENVNSEHYVTLLEQNFIPFLQRIGCELNKILFQQDGAWSQIANTVLDILSTHLSDRAISNRYPGQFVVGCSWPPYCPNLNACDSFLWGLLKDNVCSNYPQNITHLRSEIRTVAVLY
jgi:hypothetical protein